MYTTARPVRGFRTKSTSTEKQESRRTQRYTFPRTCLRIISWTCRCESRRKSHLYTAQFVRYVSTTVRSKFSIHKSTPRITLLVAGVAPKTVHRLTQTHRCLFRTCISRRHLGYQKCTDSRARCELLTHKKLKNCSAPPTSIAWAFCNAFDAK